MWLFCKRFGFENVVRRCFFLLILNVACLVALFSGDGNNTVRNCKHCVLFTALDDLLALTDIGCRWGVKCLFHNKLPPRREKIIRTISSEIGEFNICLILSSSGGSWKADSPPVKTASPPGGISLSLRFGDAGGTSQFRCAPRAI